MLFISPAFIFLFLPVALTGFYVLQARFGRRPALYWLMLASFTFYATWNPADLPILLGLISCNFIFGILIARASSLPWRRLALAGGVAFNLLVLGYFKYRYFFMNNLASVLGIQVGVVTPAIATLPLGISFIVFQKIAYLVDVYQRRIAGAGWLDFSIFASFFPQLIAGPIVHYREVGPQLLRTETSPPVSERIAIGLTIFTIGLFKKVMLADSLSPFANSIFGAASAGTTLTFFEAWLGTLCYGLQIYFDFSGYCDMAIGIARMFGIKLPLNFFSPYRATNIGDFWRRWHITLSRFLRDYLYIPLGGNRHGGTRQITNLMVTMLLGGLWHGASWNFVLWGALHGAYLSIYHFWRSKGGSSTARAGAMWAVINWAITFTAVFAAWVLFRAPTLEAAGSVWKSMAGLNGISFPQTWASLAVHLPWLNGLVRFEGAHSGRLFAADELMPVLLGGLTIVLLLPNTTQLMARYRPALSFNGLVTQDRRFFPQWHPTLLWATVTFLMFVVALLAPVRSHDFIYYQF